MIKIFFCLLIFCLTLLPMLNCDQNWLSDYKSHPCNRDCSKKTPMQCVYNFTIEYYTVLSRNCFECEKSIEDDCFQAHCVSANGFKRPIKVVNRILPGPSIEICQGDSIIVNTNNNLHSFESTTIHWHGLKQKGSNHMDGVGMITQCPIVPHTSFQYSFSAVDAGTHLWHAHSAGQRADGIFGAIVVRTASDVNSNLYDYDLSEHVIVLNDWMDQSLISKYTTWQHDFGDEAIRGILINGRGVDVSTRKHRLSYETPRSVFRVEHGKRYRFRSINSGVQYCPLQVSIDEHNITLIATDGNPIVPTPVTSFYILPGERLDFVLMTNRDIDNYWIRVKGHADCEEDSIYQTAILSYIGADNDTLPSQNVDYDSSGPTTDGIAFNPFNQEIDQENEDKFLLVDQVRSLVDETNADILKNINKTVNKKFYLALDMNTVKNTDVYDDATWDRVENESEPWTSPQINNITFHMSSRPLVFNQFPTEIMCDPKQQAKCKEDSEEFCKCLHTLEVDLYDNVEVIVVDGGSQQENHPIHLHGQSFAVLGVEKLGDSVLMENIKEMDNNGELKRNLKNPPLKDTVTVPSGGYTIFRFYAENPGIWLMHCHVEFHSEAGMALIFKVGNQKQIDQVEKPADWPTCGDYSNPKTIKSISSITKVSLFVLNICLFLFVILF